MSVHRENVTWQSPDGTWNRGFYDYHSTSPRNDDEEWDYEWDVEYDYDSFNWCSTGHPTAEAADASWDGANPGGGSRITYDPTYPEGLKRIAALEDHAAALCEAEAERNARVRAEYAERGQRYYDYSYGNQGPYVGPPKTRRADVLRHEYNELASSQWYYQSEGYSNDNRPQMKTLMDKIAARQASGTMSAEETAALSAAEAEYIPLLRKKRDGINERLAQSGRDARYGYGAGFASQQRRRREAVEEMDELIGRLEDDAERAAKKKAAPILVPPVDPKKVAAAAKMHESSHVKAAPRAGKAVAKKAPAKTAAKKIRKKDVEGVTADNGGQFAAKKKAAPSKTASLGTPAVGDDLPNPDF